MAKEQDVSALQALKAAIKSGQLANLYIFHGEEVFLLHHYLEQLKKCVLDELTESFNHPRFTSETFDLRAFADAVEQMMTDPIFFLENAAYPIVFQQRAAKSP